MKAKKILIIGMDNQLNKDTFSKHRIHAIFFEDIYLFKHIYYLNYRKI
jgi:hypothetical protein